MTGASPGLRFARIAAAIRAELVRLESVAEEAQSALRDYATGAPSLLELRGIGDVVHDFYTGIERIFERIAPEFGGIPEGRAWHRELLEDMSHELPNARPPVVEPATAVLLNEFLRFRHLFRNVYGFDLDWSKIRPLLERLPATWHVVRADLERFAEFLDGASS